MKIEKKTESLTEGTEIVIEPQRRQGREGFFWFVILLKEEIRIITEPSPDGQERPLFIEVLCHFVEQVALPPE